MTRYACVTALALLAAWGAYSLGYSEGVQAGASAGAVLANEASRLHGCDAVAASFMRAGLR